MLPKLIRFVAAASLPFTVWTVPSSIAAPLLNASTVATLGDRANESPSAGDAPFNPSQFDLLRSNPSDSPDSFPLDESQFDRVQFNESQFSQSKFNKSQRDESRSPAPLQLALEPTSPSSSSTPGDRPDDYIPANSQIVRYPSEIRPLPGQLDSVPVFNSNSPELVMGSGILLSTFPGWGRSDFDAHLDYAFEGRFDIFSHHISRARTQQETRSLFQGIIVENPTRWPVRLEILQGASYLTRPDALFVNLPDYVDNPLGTAFSGPGSRTSDYVLRGRRQSNWPALTVLEPYESRMLMNLPIPAGTVVPTSNGRSALLRLFSDGPVYVANLAMYAPQDGNGNERVPTLEEWQNLLDRGSLVSPRDLTPTPITDFESTNRTIYSRVAGVSIGSRWEAALTDDGTTDHLSVPTPGNAISYGISTLHQGRLGTDQIQSAEMLLRYDDTAFLSHGNYGVEYMISIPLYNDSDRTRTVSIALQTPLKQDQTNGALTFLSPPDDRIFFRGTVRLRYENDRSRVETRYVHVVQRRGQQGEPLLVLQMPPGDRRLVEVDLIYPPDSTPPQVISIRSE